MESYTILVVGVVSVLGVLMYAAHGDKARAEKIDKEVSRLQEEFLKMKTEFARKIFDLGNKVEINSIDTFKHLNLNNSKLVERVEILEVRQRSLEKKIISSERTVKLVFGAPIPVQHEAVKGRGKAALIRETKVT
jgi:hypothetical protein